MKKNTAARLIQTKMHANLFFQSEPQESSILPTINPKITVSTVRSTFHSQT